MKVKSLFVIPWTAALQAPLSMGFSRQEYWSGVPSPSSQYLYEKYPKRKRDVGERLVRHKVQKVQGTRSRDVHVTVRRPLGIPWICLREWVSLYKSQEYHIPELFI